MTGRERTLGALSFEDTGRPPISGGLIQDAGFLASVIGVEDFWTDPRGHAFEAFRRLGCDAVLGPVMPKPADTTTRDSAGRATSFKKHLAVPELTTPEEVAEHAAAVPSPGEVRQQFDGRKAYDDYVALMKQGQEEAGEMLLIPHCLGFATNFPTSDGFFSYEAFLMACGLYPEKMQRLFDNWGEHSRLRLEAVAQATTDHSLMPLIWIGADICAAKGPVLSPALLERLYFGAVARAIEPLKDAGMKVVWHMDANYREILPQMIALGIDGFQGFYETEDGIRLQDLAPLKARSGDPLIFFGSVSTAWVLPRGSADEVRREVERCMDVGWGRGGLLLAPTSSIGPEVPHENIHAMYEHARNYVPS